jgi:hypothetical protein
MPRGLSKFYIGGYRPESVSSKKSMSQKGSAFGTTIKGLRKDKTGVPKTTIKLGTR